MISDVIEPPKALANRQGIDWRVLRAFDPLYCKWLAQTGCLIHSYSVSRPKRMSPEEFQTVVRATAIILGRPFYG